MVKGISGKKLLNLLTKIVFSPQKIFEFIQFFFKDLYFEILTYCKFYNYGTNYILIIAVPKSGSSLLEQYVSKIPGFLSMNKSLLRNLHGKNLLKNSHDINDEMLNSFPLNKYSLLKLHCHFSQKLENFIKNNKIILLLRDPRDMLISRYYHLMEDTNHAIHKKIKNLNFNDGFLTSIQTISEEDGISGLKYYKLWYLNWITFYKKNKTNILLIKYENLIKDPKKIIEQINRFYELNLSKSKIQKIVNTKLLKNKTLKSNLKNSLFLNNTYRKGSEGDWKTLSKKNMKLLCNEFRHIIYEYEKNI